MFLMILTPTILFISLTIYQFERGENKRIEASADGRTSTFSVMVLRLGILINVLLIIYYLSVGG